MWIPICVSTRELHVDKKSSAFQPRTQCFVVSPLLPQCRYRRKTTELIAITAVNFTAVINVNFQIAVLIIASTAFPNITAIKPHYANRGITMVG